MDNFKCHAIISISLNIIVIICLCCEYRYIKKENDELIYNQTNEEEEYIICFYRELVVGAN